MKKLIATAAIACGLMLFVGSQPVLAQHRGGGGHGGGGGWHGGGSRGGEWRGGGWGGSGWSVGLYGGGLYAGYGRGYYGGYYGRPYYGYGYSYPYYSGYAYTPYYTNNYYTYPSYTYVPGDYYNYAGPLQSSGTVIRQSAYSPPEQTDRARVEVILPDPNAKVFFDDNLTQQTGSDRVFTTPTLNPGQQYTYTIRATWMDRGNQVNWSKDIKVEAGRETTVDFRNPGASPVEK